jgi:GT2 family glycosyltransferase
LQLALEAEIEGPVEVVFDKERSVAGAWNRGIEIAQGHGFSTHLITAVDVSVGPGLVGALLQFGSENPRCAIWSPTARRHSHVYLSKGNALPNISGSCDFSCFMLRNSTISEHGWFDREFKPAYVEDVDYFVRVVLGGGDARRLVSIHHRHTVSLTIKQDPEMAHHVRHWRRRNQRRYFRKWKTRSDNPRIIKEKCFSTPFDSGKPRSWWPEQDRPNYDIAGGIHE